MENNHKRPPFFLERLLEYILYRRTGYSAIGDFAENYSHYYQKKGFLYANSWYCFHILASFPQFTAYKFYWSNVMFRNYVKVAFRSILKQKVYSFINISGLSIGMAACLLIYLYIQNELSYDRYHENADRIYRVAVQFNPFGNEPNYAGSPAPLAAALMEKYPEIEQAVRFDDFAFKAKALVSSGDRSFYESKFFLADASLFEVFSFPLIKGNPQTALANPKNVVITESMVEKYFGDEDPIGKTLTYENSTVFEVSGVMEDIPKNSHFTFDFVASFDNLSGLQSGNYVDNWGTWNFYTYILLKENVSVHDFGAKIEPFLKETINQPATLRLQALTDIHLRSDIGGELETNGSMTNVYVFSVIAVIILLIACINFMNLYTASSEVRSKEVGMRKVVGARRNQLITQFMGESILLSFFALPIALLLVTITLTPFNDVMNVSLNLNLFNDYTLVPTLFLLTLVVGILSGSYPALFISAFRPISVLRGKLSSRASGFSLRNMLVVGQFAVSVSFIAGSMIVSGQMQFMRNQKLGYDRENIVNIPIYSPESRNNFDVFRNEIVNHPKVIGATATSFTPSVTNWNEGLSFEGREESDNVSFFRMSGDFNIIELFKIEMLAGRSFNKEFPNDLQGAFVLNEAAIKAIEWSPEEAIGKQFGNNGKVIGVAKDFNFRSLHNEVQPMAINVSPRMFQYISIRIQQGDIPETLAFLEESWKKVNTGLPFEYYFYDDEFDKLYKADEKSESLFRYFTFLAIFVACLGLLGLASFSVEQRTKEIGIRKVLGARFSTISMLIARDFIWLIIIANVLAWPLTYFGAKEWLQNFAFKAPTDISIFIFASGLTVLIALFTVSFHIIRAQHINPVESLRNE